MPFSFYSPTPLTPEQSSPYANLIQNALQTYGQGVKARYLPLTTQAEAASKLAYANLMGPQFIAKLMGNPQILANIPEQQRDPLLKLLLQTGTTQAFNPKIAETFAGQNIQQPQTFTAVSQAFRGRNPQEQNYLDNMSPGDSYTAPQVPPSGVTRQDNKTWAERRGEYAGVEKEGEKLGEYRAEDIKSFGDQYESGLKLGDKFDELSSIITSPEFRDMRKDIPFFQGKQLSLLSKTGTPYQQELIGRYRNTAQEVVRDTINTFSGQRLKGELTISQDMKVNDDDTVDVANGKIQAAMLYKNLNMERSKIASDLMESQHLNKRKALERADKLIDGDKIRKEINDKLDYNVQIRRKKKDGTYEIKTVKRSEARRMGADV